MSSLGSLGGGSHVKSLVLTGAALRACPRRLLVGIEQLVVAGWPTGATLNKSRQYPKQAADVLHHK